MIYEYLCRTCHTRELSETRGDTLGGCACGGELRRKYSISIPPVMQEHFNKSTQTVVSSQRQFERDLRDAGSRYTEQTGIPTNYVPVDPTDTKALGITGEGLDATNRKRVAEGLPPVKIPGII